MLGCFETTVQPLSSLASLCLSFLISKGRLSYHRELSPQVPAFVSNFTQNGKPLGNAGSSEKLGLAGRPSRSRGGGASRNLPIPPTPHPVLSDAELPCCWQELSHHAGLPGILDFVDLKVPNLSSRLIHFAPGASRNSGNAPRGPRVWGVEEAESLILVCLENSRKPLGISLAP